MTDRTPLLRVRSVGHGYGGVPALSGIDIDVFPGEVLAVVGENGAGKSTLLKVLGGIVQPSEGALEIAGTDGVPRTVALAGVRGAAEAGIALVHQELNLADNLDCAGNIFLGREPARHGVLDLRRMHDEARTWMARVGLDVDPATPCGALPIAQRQLVEIAKALSCRARVLVLDEPTSSLSARETERLLGIMDELRAAGTAVVFVSHHLDEVLWIADRIVVLRDGRRTGELRRGACDRAAIERLMVGRDIAAAERRAPAGDARVRLRLRGVTTAHPRTRPVDLDVRAGEIVGLAGLVGAGRTELLEAIAGLDAHGGSVELDGAPLVGPASARVARGLAIVPEDRARNGIFAPDPVAMNVGLAWIGRHAHAGVVDRAGAAATVRRTIDRMQLRPADPAKRVGTLSGGNQQKTVIGRWIAVDPAVLLLDEPTRGVDVGARAEIHAEVRRLADAGAAVVFASSELEEILLLADRVVVMHDGRVAGELPAHAADELAIMRLATGGVPARQEGAAP